MMRSHFLKLVLAVLALAICSGTMQAAITGPASVTLTCDTVNGPGAAVPVPIKLAVAGTGVLVTPSFPVGSPLAALPAAQTVASATTATNFNFSVAAGCAGAMNGQQVTLTFTPAGGTAINVIANITVTGPTLLTSDHNSGITLSCNTTTGATAGIVGIKILAGASVSVTPSFTNGAPLAAAPAPATVSSSSTYTNFSFSVAAGCANAVNGQTVTLTFTPASGTPLNVTATLSVGGPTLMLSQAAFNLSCDLFSGPGAPQSVGVTLKVAGASQMVSVTASPSGILSLPAGQSVSSTTVPSTFAFNVVQGCGGATNNQQITITFTPAVGNPITATATIAVTTPTLASAQYAGVNLPCDTLLGPSPVTIGVTTYAATGSYVVSAVSASPSTVIVAPVGSTTVNSNTVATNWTVHAAAGCRNVVNNVPVQITFTPTGSGLQPLVINVTPIVTTSNGSALALSPSAVTIQCTKVGSVYSNITSATVYVSSPANYGTPFSVDNAQGSAPPSYISATTTPASNAIATASAIPLLITTNASCGGLPVGNTVVHVNLANAPAADKVITVTVQVGGPAPLSASAVALSYIKGSSSYPPQTSTITGPANIFYSVDQASLPLWLNATTASGTLSSGGSASLTFRPTAGAETLAPGSYSATVNLKVAFALDSPVTVTLQVKSAPASLVIVERTVQNLSWVLGAGTLPSLSITPISTSDAPIPYTVVTASTANGLVPQVPSSSGIAYSFGPSIPVTFLQAPFSAASPGMTLSGTVAISGGGTTITVTINVTVVSPDAHVTSFTPTNLPTASSGQQFTVVIFGTGFVSDSYSPMTTKVGAYSGGSVVSDANIAATVQNSTTIYLTITVPANADPFLPFSGAGGSIQIGLCNPGEGGSPCYNATDHFSIGIGVNPIVQTVTSASSYMQATPPALTAIAPYDILSVFGTNFCISGGTGCTTPNPNIMFGIVDPNTLGYMTQLTPDGTVVSPRNLKVTFQTHGSSPTVIAAAPLLFATNSQINVLVPEAVKDYTNSTVDLVVSFGYGAPNSGTLLTSAPYSLTVSPTNPGIFAMTGDGQGDAAALDGSYQLIKSTNPAGINSSSDTISLYLTGLGVPDSDGATGTWSASCMAAGDYYPIINAAVLASTNQNPGLTSDDGLVLQNALFPAATPKPPCFISTGSNVPTVKIGGVTADVGYAGWVPGSVAGLYQMNIQLPPDGSNFSPSVTGTTPVRLPIVVTAGNMKSQLSGVYIYAVQSPTVTVAPVAATLNTLLTPVTPFTVTGGSGHVSYALAAGNNLPAGLTMDATGLISGTPTVSGPFTVVVTVTDQNSWHGTATITFNIAAS